MKRVFKILGWTIGGLITLVILFVVGLFVSYKLQSNRLLSNAGPEAPTLTENGIEFRDLNKNGQLDIYEDPRQPTAARVDDLINQMNVAEKAGLMFNGMIVMNPDGTLAESPTPSNPFSLMLPINSELVLDKLMSHFNVMEGGSARDMATWHNNIQKLAERTRLGIPITIFSDPRHGFMTNPAASIAERSFSQWPEQAGLAATRDSVLVYEFGRMAQQEYRAIGIRGGLHPMADLATEPRWSRLAHTFGEDAELAAKLTYAYVKGFQGDTLGRESVAMMSKHFTGGGPQQDGSDAHFEYGKHQVYPGGQFEYHLIPFEKGALAAGTAQIMPYYSIPKGQTSEEVGYAFNKDIITGLLREKYGFDGVVCTDWNLLTPMGPFGFTMVPAIGWGVEDLTPEERIVKALEAGVDQFGGEMETERIISLVEDGILPESRLDISARRILRDKFTLGLFDNPYVDVEAADAIAGRADFVAAGELAQRKSIVLLANNQRDEQPSLPLSGRPKLYIENIDPETAGNYGEMVETPEEADFAILRLSTPYEPRSGSLLESFMHQGDLDFKSPEKERLMDIMTTVPTIIDMYLERATVMPELAEHSAGLLANFGANDAAVLDVIFGEFNPSGKLPFELPSSMEAVHNQMEDMPYDSVNPLFPFGHGLSYE